MLDIIFSLDSVITAVGWRADLGDGDGCGGAVFFMLFTVDATARFIDKPQQSRARLEFPAVDRFHASCWKEGQAYTEGYVISRWLFSLCRSAEFRIRKAAPVKLHSRIKAVTSDEWTSASDLFRLKSDQAFAKRRMSRTPRNVTSRSVCLRSAARIWGHLITCHLSPVTVCRSACLSARLGS